MNSELINGSELNQMGESKFFEKLDYFSKNIAIIDNKDNKLTYQQLIEESEKLLKYFKKNEKSLLFILCENNIESILGYISSLRANDACMLIDSKIDSSLFNKLVDIYKPDFLWVPAASNLDYIYKYKNYGLVLNEIKKERKINNELSLLLSTSGITGSPKTVRLTGKNLDSNARSIAKYLKLTEKERPITTLPIHYSYGLSIINSHFSVGGTILLTDDSIMTKEFWGFFKEFNTTSFAGVPYMYEMLRTLRFFNMDLPSIKTMTQAGGKLAPEHVLEFAEFTQKKGINFYVMYGQTEATARISYLPPEKNIEKYRSIGIAIPGGRLSIIDENGEEIKTSYTDGELIYCGDNVMMGYAENEKDLEKGDELNGILKTGDIAQFDDDGYFYITGRKNRFIKIYGSRANLDEIELFLKSKGYNCVCGGRDDLLCIASANSDSLEEINNILAKKYGFHHSLIKIIKVEEVKRGASGKILYNEVFKDLT